MESKQFDQLVTALHAHDTRRVLLRILLSSALAVSVGTHFEEVSGKTRKSSRRKKRRRQAAATASTCVPLHQTCVPLVGSPCCDQNASCVVSQAGSTAGLPDSACRDTSTPTCTSDAECQARFPKAGPDIACRDNIGGSFCPKGVPGTGHCCGRRNCSATNPCQGGICCGLGGLGGHEVCCAPGQECLPFLGCTAL
jgi:hypothetical protein